MSVGLTGGIASGKSLVSAMLARHGATVIDVDRVAWEAYSRGTAGHAAVAAAFGPQVVGADGEIDRRVLGGLVFGKAGELRKLTDIVWPLTRERLEAIKSENALRPGVLVLEAAVLIEANWLDLVDEVWVATVPVDTARERLMARNGISADQADARIASQITNEERTRHANVVIDNSGDIPALEKRVEAAWSVLAAKVPGEAKQP